MVLQHRRSERVTKRQKYVDDLQLDISDEELPKDTAMGDTGIVMASGMDESVTVSLFSFNIAGKN